MNHNGIAAIAIVFILFAACNNENRIVEKYQQEVKHYTELIKQEHDNPFNYYNRGGAYYLSKNYDKAIEDHKQAIRKGNRFVQI